ncbi:MAG: hypothetical protein JWP08_211, partial [Bryobacterales bacterium]|nr:hypothetical protein [Bryobacterales bacterium]
HVAMWKQRNHVRIGLNETMLLAARNINDYRHNGRH